MTDKLLPYWMAFAHAKSFSNGRKMDFLIEVVHDKQIPLDEALIGIKKGDRLGFKFDDKEWYGISEASQEVANYSFLAEQLLEKGINAIHIMDKFVYPSVLKKNLKKDAPIIVYAKGNMDLLKKNSIAIVGARKSNDTSLNFTKNVANKAVKSGSVVVSGFAKGVDKMALDAALEYKGQSIIVLPQGINTYTSKEYYSHIVDGDVLVMSTYHPKAPWSVGLAMDRNKIIYGLAEEIYAAESNESGGTWEGVLNGLKRNRTVFVRMPGAKEKNANLILIQKGATAVDINGNPTTPGLKDSTEQHMQVSNLFDSTTASSVDLHDEEPVKSSVSLTDWEIREEAIKLLKDKKGKGLKPNELSEILGLDDKAAKRVNTILSNSPKLRKEEKGRFNFYYLVEELPKQGDLF